MTTTPQSTAPSHVPVLDGWRGVAVLGVLFGHFVTIQGINLGRFGVELQHTNGHAVNIVGTCAGNDGCQ